MWQIANTIRLSWMPPYGLDLLNWDEAVTKTITRSHLYIGIITIKIRSFQICVYLTFLTPGFAPPDFLIPPPRIFERAVLHHHCRSAETRFNAAVKICDVTQILDSDLSVWTLSFGATTLLTNQNAPFPTAKSDLDKPRVLLSVSC